MSDQKFPMQIFLVLGAGTMLIIQKVAPLPRIWGYLEMFYLFFSATGLVGVGHVLFKVLNKQRLGQITLSSMILLSVIFTFANVTFKTQNRAARLDSTNAPELFAAKFLAKHLTNKDTLIAVAPTDIQTAYYLKINGIPYDFFYQRDHPVKIQNAMVLVRTRGGDYGFDTLDKVVDFYNLAPILNMASGEQVFDYGPLFIYSIPAK
jgi:hypothetical protein